MSSLSPLSNYSPMTSETARIDQINIQSGFMPVWMNRFPLQPNWNAPQIIPLQSRMYYYQAQQLAMAYSAALQLATMHSAASQTTTSKTETLRDPEMPVLEKMCSPKKRVRCSKCCDDEYESYNPDGKPCRCRICNKTFTRHWLLTNHMRVHTGEKPFACRVCDRRFADRSNARCHAWTHSHVKCFQCDQCDKQFRLRSYLNKHKQGQTCQGRETSLIPTPSIAEI